MATAQKTPLGPSPTSRESHQASKRHREQQRRQHDPSTVGKTASRGHGTDHLATHDRDVLHINSAAEPIHQKTGQNHDDNARGDQGAE